jgi:hypothetical protein
MLRVTNRLSFVFDLTDGASAPAVIKGGALDRAIPAHEGRPHRPSGTRGEREPRYLCVRGYPRPTHAPAAYAPPAPCSDSSLPTDLPLNLMFKRSSLAESALRIASS